MAWGLAGFSIAAARTHVRLWTPRLCAVLFLLAAVGPRQAEAAAPVTVSEDEDPLPAKSPENFDPDPGGVKRPAATTEAPPDFSAVPNLFEPLLPPPPPNYGTTPLPYKLRLPRAGALPTREILHPLPYPQYELTEGNVGLLPNVVPQYNRWRIPFGQYVRYANAGLAETPYQDGPLRFFDPYKASLLKGDSPIIGQDIFLSITMEDQFLAEFRKTPVPSGVSTARPDSTDFYGRGDSYTINNNLSATVEIFKGETSFKPIDWAIRITPIFNINYSEFNENGVVNPDPRGPNYVDRRIHLFDVPVINNPGDVDPVLANGSQPGGSGLRYIGTTDLGHTRYDERTRETVSVEEAYIEIHLRDLTNNYDFVSLRAGNQFLNSDFRGFIFQDTDTGLRLFGNYDNNRYQYNLAYFNLREKDTFSGLNEYSARAQDVVVANIFRQDTLNLFLPSSDPLALGYTTEISFHASMDHGDTHYDKDGFLVRPAPIGGPITTHEVNSFYLGCAGDGHIGWLNLSHAFYEVLGRDDKNGIAGHAVDINAQMAAIELSIDHDYLRPKISFFYASGDGNPRSKTATGFDSILDNPTFAGSPFSYFTRQGLELGNTNVLTKTANSLLLDLRTSKTEGQANFVNPGTLLFNTGVDIDLTQKLKAQINANYIRFVDTAPIKTVLLDKNVDDELGYDLSIGFTYRPTLTQNIIINAGFGVLLPGTGYRQIYRSITDPPPGFSNKSPGQVDSFVYSGIIAVTLTY